MRNLKYERGDVEMGNINDKKKTVINQTKPIRNVSDWRVNLKTILIKKIREHKMSFAKKDEKTKIRFISSNIPIRDMTHKIDISTDHGDLLIFEVDLKKDRVQLVLLLAGGAPVHRAEVLKQHKDIKAEADFTWGTSWLHPNAINADTTTLYKIMLLHEGEIKAGDDTCFESLAQARLEGFLSGDLGRLEKFFSTALW